MSYKALYRQFRPLNFDEMYGQKHILKILRNQIINDNIAHAYLLSGTRGTGKTSTAKIFSRAVNCQNPENGNPCNKCESCLGLLDGTNLDVLEMDAASNNSVDDIRDLKDKVKYPPTNGKYKVYIIDEVHMLSKGAFNALLKTLEEPPEYLIFILATTEPQKLPATILSRCQRYDFKRIDTDDVINNMTMICDTLGIAAEDKALRLIARNCDGAMRDAHSILDQCISLSDDKLTYDYVLSIMGAVKNDSVFNVSESIIKFDVYSTLKNINDIINDGKDIGQFIKDLIAHFRNLMICKAVDDISDIIDLTLEDQNRLKLQSEEVSLNTITRIINLLSEAEIQIKKTTQPRIILEVAIIKILNPESDNSLDDIVSRMDKLEHTIQSGQIKIETTSNTIQEKETDDKEVKKKVKKESVTKEVANQDVKTVKEEKLVADDDIANSIKENWKKIISEIKKEKIKIYTLITNGTIEVVKNNTVVVSFKKEYEFFKNALETADNKLYVEQFLTKKCGCDISIKYIIQGDRFSVESNANQSQKDTSLTNKAKALFGDDILEIKE